MAEELFDVVDADDCVIGVAPRSEVHARLWWHRAVHIFVRNSRGDLLIHRRSATKVQYPLCWTSSASGHLAAGEDYGPAAERELLEELGICSPLRFVAKFPASPEMCYEHTVLYETVTDTVPTFDPGEIEHGEYLPLSTIAARIGANPDDYSPCFRTIFAWYQAQPSSGFSSSSEPV
ncbi:MAG: NUDIX hydrolase [Planctomycetales bacterium 12-60-4]|nr:MAG: NUDIX hydrolase [Planctomycetales bacterium 12-60-4]